MKKRLGLGQLDWVMLGTLMSLSLAGIMVIRSAEGTASPAQFHLRQAYWLTMALVAFFIGNLVDRRLLRRSAYFLYCIILLVLVYLAVFGKLTGGVHRWIHIGGLTFQPSEIGKLTLILCLARYFHKMKKKPPYSLGDIVIPMGIVGAYVIPIVLQPDLGTAMFMILLSIPIFLFMGIKRWTVLFTMGTAAIGAPFLFFSLKKYQQERILSFLSPERDPLGAGYHVVQSKIAIGSGGIMGKGYLQGTQSQLRFIPEQHTDFIVSVLGEEFGFVGVAVVLGLVFFLTLWILSYLEVTKTRFGMLTVIGLTCAFAMQSVINIAMTIGFLPVVGLPFPLLSYGGSSLVTTFLGFGIVAGYRRRRT